MEQKERLVQLIIDSVNGCARNWAEVIANHLIENGIIVPPCKVGSEVYFADHDNNIAFNGNVVSYSLDAAHLWFNCHYKCGLNIWHPIEDFGKTVFLTREDAEKVIAERSKE